jgi:predicted transcriptional regulator
MVMAQKTEVMTLRLEPEVMEALATAARKERRTKANMAEVAIIEYAKKLRVYQEPEGEAPAKATKKRKRG